MRRFGMLAFVLVAFTVFAAGQWIDLEKRFTPEQMRAAGLDKLTAEELATLNRLLREQDVATPPPPVASQPQAEPQPDTSRMLGFNDAPIVTRVIGTVSGWEPGTEFELANGQRWKVLKGTYKLRTPLESPEVRVVPGAMGRWFFRIDEDTPGARVYRID